ncbi:unnamed protein product [Rhodiola kirilowii]
MDPELTVAEVEALNKLADDLEKLNKQMQRFEESRRLQAESRAKKLDRMLDVLEQMVRRSQPKPLFEDQSTQPENTFQVSIPEVAACGLDDPSDVKVDRSNDDDQVSSDLLLASDSVLIEVAPKTKQTPYLILELQKEVISEYFTINYSSDLSNNEVVMEVDETPELKISFPFSNLNLNSCSPSVCKNASEDWPSYLTMQTDFHSYNLLPKLKVRCVKPPAKPPDDVVICAAAEAYSETIRNKQVSHRVWLQSEVVKWEYANCGVIFPFFLPPAKPPDDSSKPMSMVLPGVVGFKLDGKLRNGITATDLVLTVTQILRKHGVVGKFVEFYGDGMAELSLADRATIANMSPEYGATMGCFPVDHVTLQYLKLTGRSDETVAMIELYLRANKMFVDYNEPQQERAYSSYLRLNLEEVEPCISGPKRPHDRVTLKDMKADWHSCLDNKVGFKGFAIPKETQEKVAKFSFHGEPAELKHGSVVIAAITSCTNTSNPSVLLGAALVARKACELGLKVKPWVKTSLAPGSGVVKKYLDQSGLQKYLGEQGFHIVGYGCTTCIGNSGELDESVGAAISENDIVAAAVLYGNRNFEGRVHPLTRANYLASPPLVVAYALAGTVDIDFEKEPIRTGKDGKSIYFRDIWPSTEEISQVVESSVLPDMFKSTYESITKGNTIMQVASDQVMQDVKMLFRIEWLDQLNEIVMFGPTSHDQLRKAEWPEGRAPNKFFLFSLPRPPEIATLRTRLILRGEECYVLNIIEIKGSISN